MFSETPPSERFCQTRFSAPQGSPEDFLPFLAIWGVAIVTVATAHLVVSVFVATKY